MNPIEEIKQEHESIERELLELEMISKSPEINYSNLVHVFKKVHDLWNKHESKEDVIFPILRRNENLIVPVDNMSFDHLRLRPHKEALIEAVNSGSNEQVKITLETHVKTIIRELRKHINDEDNILFTLALDELKDQDFEEMQIALQKV